MYKPKQEELEEMGFKINSNGIYTLLIKNTLSVQYYVDVGEFWINDYDDIDIYPKSKQDLLTLISILKE